VRVESQCIGGVGWYGMVGWLDCFCGFKDWERVNCGHVKAN
jgi:hypothetical protein